VVQNKPKRTPVLFDKWSNIATKKSWLTTIQTTNEQIDLRAMILDEFEKGTQSVQEADKNYEQRVEISSLYMIKPHTSKPNISTNEHVDKRISISVIFNGKKYDALIDTGATNSCI